MDEKLVEASEAATPNMSSEKKMGTLQRTMSKLFGIRRSVLFDANAASDLNSIWKDEIKESKEKENESNSPRVSISSTAVNIPSSGGSAISSSSTPPQAPTPPLGSALMAGMSSGPATFAHLDEKADLQARRQSNSHHNRTPSLVTSPPPTTLSIGMPSSANLAVIGTKSVPEVAVHTDFDDDAEMVWKLVRAREMSILRENALLKQRVDQLEALLRALDQPIPPPPAGMIQTRGASLSFSMGDGGRGRSTSLSAPYSARPVQLTEKPTKLEAYFGQLE